MIDAVCGRMCMLSSQGWIVTFRVPEQMLIEPLRRPQGAHHERGAPATEERVTRPILRAMSPLERRTIATIG